jgi:hypothetical protein
MIGWPEALWGASGYCRQYATVDLDMKRKAIESIQPVKSKETCIQPWRSDNTILEWLESI